MLGLNRHPFAIPWRIFQGFTDRINAYIIQKKLRPLPVLIYQMGKVGSNTIYYSLKKTRISCVHVHRMLPANIEAVKRSRLARGLPLINERVGNALGERIRGGDEPVKIITMVREPVSRNISAYFQRLSDFFVGEAVNSIKVAEAMKRFLKEYSHQVPLEWFDKEFEPATGVSVYREGFDHTKGYEVIQEGRCSILIIRVEVNDETKLNAIQEFLGRKDIVLKSANVGDQKDYAELYKSFKGQIALPPEYVDHLLNSKYAKYFYGEEERAGIREAWLKSE